MARHLPEQLKRYDPAVAKLVRELYEHLPDEAKKDVDRVARVRYVVAGYILFLIMFPVGAANQGLSAFVRQVYSPFYLLALILGVIGVVLMIRRVMNVSGAVVATFEAMAPEAGPDIDRVYGRRGLGDLVAPWIRRRRGRIGEARVALFKGLLPWDRRRR